MTRARLLAVGSALALTLAGCTGPTDQASVPALRTSGPLADGFEIEPGSALIGAVFPVDVPYGGGHEAVLRIDGDVRDVVDSYLAQAEDLDYSFESEFEPGTRTVSCSDPEVEIVNCSGLGIKSDDWHVSFDGLVGPDGQSYLHFRTARYSDAPAPAPLASGGPVAPATDVELGPDLTPDADDRAIRIVEGSRPIFDSPLAGCSLCSYVAVLEVTGDLDPVMRGYLEQFAADGFTGRGLIGDDEELTFAAAIPGGASMAAAGAAGDPSYVLISGQPSYD